MRSIMPCVLFKSSRMADWPCAEIAADCTTPSVRDFPTISSRCVTVLASVVIWPVACACAVAMDCRSWRSSLICDSTTWLFFCAPRLCSATQMTRAATTSSPAIRIPDMYSPRDDGKRYFYFTRMKYFGKCAKEKGCATWKRHLAGFLFLWLCSERIYTYRLDTIQRGDPYA